MEKFISATRSFVGIMAVFACVHAAHGEEIGGIRHRDEYAALVRGIMPVLDEDSQNKRILIARLPESSSLESLDSNYLQNILQYSFLHCEQRLDEEKDGTRAGEEAPFFESTAADRAWVTNFARRVWGREPKANEVDALAKIAQNITDPKVTVDSRKIAVCAAALASPEVYLK